MPTRPSAPRLLPPRAAPASGPRGAPGLPLRGGLRPLLRTAVLVLVCVGLPLPVSYPAADASDGSLLAQEPSRGPAEEGVSGPGPEPPEWARNLALFAGLVGFDRSLEGAVAEVRRNSDPLLEDAAGAAKRVGDWHEALPVFAAGSALVGGLTEGTTGLEKTVAMLGGVFAGSLANETVNQLVGRARPSEDRGAFSFDPLHGHASFPSGHAAFGFSMAASVDAATDGWLPAAGAYTLAGATAASRIYHGKHWLSDVVVGAVVGTVVSRWATRWTMDRLGVAGAGDGEDAADAAAAGSPRPHAAAPRPGLLDRIRPVATPAFVGVSIPF